jgi:hypothetical protein
MNFRQSYPPWHRVVEALKTDRRVWSEDQTRDWARTVAQNAEQQSVFTEAMHGISLQLTNRGAISRTWWPSFSISRAQ